jgi:hypothetical protein
MSTKKTDYYSSVGAKEINGIFTISPSFCNIAQVPWGHHVALLTGRVQKGQLRGLRAVLIFVSYKPFAALAL